jgi:hypothetical protein
VPDRAPVIEREEETVDDIGDVDEWHGVVA